MKHYLKTVYNGTQYNAGGKAVDDVNIILERKRYSPLVLKKGNNIIEKIFYLISLILKILFKLKKGDSLFLQYPLYYPASSLIYKLILNKQLSIRVLIHDLNSLRYKESCEKVEFVLLQSAEQIIAHTPMMKQVLIEMGINIQKIDILNLFDYITDETNVEISNYSTSIIFAGNLSKSKFIHDLGRCNDLSFNLYGLEIFNFPSAENVIYKGKFSADNIRNIEGDWGLVWDGDSIETCSGPLGEYLRVNSSHKASLYIACEKPVIVWSESALKDYVLEHNIGIAVDSILDISKSIEELGEDKISSIKLNLKEYSKRLRSGNNLGQLLK